MDNQEETGLPVDGNATAGLLGELFAVDVTVAEINCGSCGVVAEVGETRVYGGVMGAIFRCPNCDSIVMRLVHTPVGIWLDMRGSRCLFAPSVDG
jgi:predicted RNA-binding Zn-ribbon protein involved in translation (DUF1610 family)